MKSIVMNAAAWREAMSIGMAAATLAASIGMANAQQIHKYPTYPYYGAYQNAAPPPALSRWDRSRFDRSGTRGREGLGASPLRPEGPGNVSD
ncbi:hypothetical protein RZS28_03450 [Methylocapsa polymorpha]|uniref:BA14K family protein n=1 Tax=Methylocapsa polymorpha TaxID=3080828 RepID=A0ABZ0HU97_9HYPH|nr:hypothetical protein RZS28_03450 [Methylocapsa sp. RX1]